MSRGGIVAAESPLAAQAGAAILARGGNAVDAAVAANAVMGVVAPMMNGMGGDLFAIVYDAKTGKLYGLNASGWAPASLTIEVLKSRGIEKMPGGGIQSVTVPGAVDGWSKLLDRFGRKKFSEVLAPAIHYAADGFPVSERTAVDWDEAAATVRNDSNAAKTYFPDGRAPGAGDIFRNRDLANSLEKVAAGGRDAYYKGEIARAIVETSKRLGGTMTLDDLAEYSSEWVEPISTTYRDWTVYEIPPNGQGIAALEMLNLMERFPLADAAAGSADSLHIMIEAKKLAYADLLRYIGDPKFSRIPVAELLSKRYAGIRVSEIDSGTRQLRRKGRNSPARWRRHDVSLCSGRRRQHGFADPEQLLSLRLRDRGRRNRLRAAESRRSLLARSSLAERSRGPQAPAAHDHSRLHGARR